MSIAIVQSKILDNPATPAGNFDNPTTAGNCVAVAMMTYSTSNVTISTSGVTLGGSADNFSEAYSVQSGYSGATAYCALWIDPSCGGGQTAISVTMSNGTWGSGDAGIVLLELSGVAASSPVDETVSNWATSGGNTAGQVTSGTTTGSAVANEAAIGILFPDASLGNGGLNAGSVPSSYTSFNIDTAPYVGAVGFLDLGAAGSTTVYNGTAAVSGVWAALLVTLKPGTGGGGGGGGGGGALTFSGSYSPATDWTTTTSPKTQTVTASTGNLVLVLGGTADAGTTLTTPSSSAGGPSSWTLLKSAATAGTCAAYAWSGVMPPPGALAVTTTTLPNANIGTAYSQALAASGGTGAGYTWSVSIGSLPGWASLSGAGVISGSPSTASVASFTVQVTDSGSNTATQTLTLTTLATLNPTWDPSGSWTLVFSDEFNGTSLDTTKWGAGWQGKSGITNPINSGEKVAGYNSANVSVSGGTLNLKLDGTYGACVTTNTDGSGGSPGFSFTYPVAIEGRIQLQQGSGQPVANFPAFWTDGQSWPQDGEIDIMEGLGGDTAAHVHDNATDGPNGGGAPGITHDLSPVTGWHTYGCYWTAGSVQFYYDGSSIGSLATDGFTGPHYLIINNTYSSSLVTGTINVDWVRFWTPG